MARTVGFKTKLGRGIRRPAGLSYRHTAAWLDRKQGIERRVERRVERATKRREDREKAAANGKPVKYRVA